MKLITTLLLEWLSEESKRTEAQGLSDAFQL